MSSYGVKRSGGTRVRVDLRGVVTGGAFGLGVSTGSMLAHAWCCGRGQWDILCVNTSRVVSRRGNCLTPDVVNVTFHHSAMWKLCIMYMHIIMHVHTRRNFQRGDILYDKGKLCNLII